MRNARDSGEDISDQPNGSLAQRRRQGFQTGKGAGKAGSLAGSFVIWTLIALLVFGALYLILDPPVAAPRVSLEACSGDDQVAALMARDTECHSLVAFLHTKSSPGRVGLEGKRVVPGLSTCVATPSEWAHLNKRHVEGGECPKDWLLAQTLMFFKDCFLLPKRNCFTMHSPQYRDPPPRNEALWSDPDIHNVQWEHYACANFTCLRERVVGDCRECFDWGMEKGRWNWLPNHLPTLKDVLALKPPGELRIGLDIGGGSGSFAARMLEHNVTMVTTGLNSGAPFLETVALRGLPALHVSIKSRLPLLDATIDFIHTQHCVQFLSLDEFEYMLFDWDRVLRPGGLIWLEKLYEKNEDMPKFMQKVELLGYKRHSWVEWKRNKDSRKFSAVLEKLYPPQEGSKR